jgi:hypothetical protein
MKTLKYIAWFDSKRRDCFDERRKYAVICGAYFDEHGDEYRKSFNFPVGTTETEARELMPKSYE